MPIISKFLKVPKIIKLSLNTLSYGAVTMSSGRLFHSALILLQKEKFLNHSFHNDNVD